MGRAVRVSVARHAAYETLRRVRERGAYGPETLAAVLGERALETRDAAHATRLAVGVLQTAGTLDAALDRFVSRPRTLEPRVRDVLRVAAYELLYTDTPAWAAVNEAVEAARAFRPQAATLANAVLRRLADAASGFPWGDPDSDIAALALLGAHPRWLTETLVGELGTQRAQLVLRADNEPAPLYLRHNPFRGPMPALLHALAEDGAEPRPCHLPGCVEAGEPAAAVRGEALAQGLAVVADAAAQVAPLAVGPRPGDTVIEVASGRGTKTLQLQATATEAGQPARLYALDLHAFKADVLATRMRDLGVPGVTPLVGDATRPDSVAGLPPAGSAGAVLVDAPCSGTGTLRRRPEKRWRIDAAGLRGLAALQSSLLAAASSLVRPGGILVYSTCSILAEENERVAETFLGSGAGKDFRTKPLSDVVPAEWSSFLLPSGWFRSLPSIGGPDGHFVAAFHKMEGN